MVKQKTVLIEKIDITKVKGTLISKLQITENQKKSDLSENNKVAYDFLLSELHMKT